MPFSQPRPAMCSRAGLPIAPRSKAPAVISLTTRPSSAWHELPTPQVRAKAAPQAWRRAAGIVEGLPFIFADSPTHSPWAGPQGSRLLSLAPAQWRQVTAKQLPVLQASGAGSSPHTCQPLPSPSLRPAHLIDKRGWILRAPLPPSLSSLSTVSLLSSSPFSLPLSVNTPSHSNLGPCCRQTVF